MVVAVGGGKGGWQWLSVKSDKGEREGKFAWENKK